MRLDPASWTPRERPLEPAGAVAFGSVAAAFGRSLVERELDGLRGAVAEGVLLVVGPGSRIPWVDGLCWLGRDPEAPALLLPTTHTPPVHPALLARRLGASAVTLDPPRRLRLGALAAIDRVWLVRWMEAL